jgi:hypothetical protein
MFWLLLFTNLSVNRRLYRRTYIQRCYGQTYLSLVVDLLSASLQFKGSDPIEVRGVRILDDNGCVNLPLDPIGARVEFLLRCDGFLENDPVVVLFSYKVG